MTKSKQPTAEIDQRSTKAAEGVQRDALEEEDLENSHLLARLMLPNNFLYFVRLVALPSILSCLQTFYCFR